MRDALLARKHSVLLGVAVLAETFQSFAATPGGEVVFVCLVILVVLVTFLVVFESPQQRTIGVLLGGPGLLADFGHYALAGPALHVTEVLHNLFMCAFLFFAAVTILQTIFQRRDANFDAVVGAVCGYVLAGAAFANLYTLVENVSPGSFSITTSIGAHFTGWHARRSLFGYFSIVTLTTMGYGDITPVVPTTAALAWIEAVFGQFYIAVVVAQLVSIRMMPKPATPAPPPAEGHQ
jgi:voltage-gated potassium channel